MSDTPKPLHPSIYLLADHLDAALAAGEDLQAERLELSAAKRNASADKVTGVARFVDDLHALELIMIARVLQARRRAEEIKGSAPSLKPLASLFVSGTAALVDAAAELGDLSSRQFVTGNTPMAYLRGRGMLASDAAGLATLDHLAVTEEFLVAERIRLGALMDLIAAFLDSLDLVFDLYRDDEVADQAAPEAAAVAEAPRSLDDALKRLTA